MTIRIHTVWIVSFLYWGCISKIDLTPGGQSVITINGVFSNSPGERVLRVSRTNGLDTLAIPLSASAEIFQNGSPYGSLVPIETGRLKLPDELELLAGQRYEIEVSLADGRRFRTLSQEIQPLYKQDSLTLEYSPRDVRQDDGTLEFNWFAELHSHITSTTNASGTQYFRWQVDNSWSLRDWRDSLCYLQEGTDEFPSVLFSSNALSPGPQKIRLASRELDFAFFENFFFNAYLHPIDSQTYAYYEQAEALISNEGTLFDELPAPIIGNVREVIGDELGQAIPGYVEFSLADTARLRVRAAADIPIEIRERCHENACQFIIFPPPCPCHNCRLFFLEYYATETSIPPDYWR